MAEPPHALSGRLTPEGHELTQRVYFEDTDFSGRVYHARYLHFLERGRSDYLRLLGVSHVALAAEGEAFAVRRMQVEFLRPAGIDDVLVIESRVLSLAGARIVLAQAIVRASDKLVEAAVTIALIGEAGKAVRIPAGIRDAFRRSATRS